MSLNSHAAYFEIGSELGFNTNPLALEQKPISDGYLKYWIQVKYEKKFNKTNKIQAKIKYELTDYFNVSADKQRLDYRLRYSKTFNINKFSNNLMVTHDFRSERQIHFNRINNIIAQTLAGDNLSARYDFDEPKLSLEWIFRLNKKSSLSLYGFVARRNYINDYKSIGLDSLDYFERGAQLSYRYKLKNDFNFRLFIYDKTRFYDSFLNGDVNGSAIPGSVLNYHFLGYGLVMNKYLSKNYLLGLYASGYLADDNAVAYRDMVFHSININLKKSISDGHYWKIDNTAYIKDFVLDSTRPIEVLKGNPGRIKIGLTFNFYHQNYWIEDIVLYEKLSLSSERNSIDLLSYSAVSVAIGVKYSF